MDKRFSQIPRFEAKSFHLLQRQRGLTSWCHLSIIYWQKMWNVCMNNCYGYWLLLLIFLVSSEELVVLLTSFSHLGELSKAFQVRLFATTTATLYLIL